MSVRIPKRSRRILASLAFGTALVSASPMAVAWASAGPGYASGNTMHFGGIPPVGALFSAPDYTGADAAHFCTGTVISSPEGDLVLTAAHCVYDASTHTYTHSAITFAPGYDNAPQARYGGVWNVEKIEVPPGYMANGDTEDDYAFLVLAPNNGVDIQRYTGALQLSRTWLPAPVTVMGYNDLQYDSAGNSPIMCSAEAFEETDGGEPWSRFNCPNYQDGTSGGPWLIQGTDAVMGVIGGYEQGGDSPDWSYSAIFNAATLEFYHSVEWSSARP